MTTQDMLDERYGRTSSARKRWAITAVLAVAATAIGLLAWSTVSSALDDVGVDTTGFAVVDSRTVMLSFQITAPRDRPVACILEAQDEEHGVVGWRIIEIPASSSTAQAFRESVPTTAEATTGFVNSCWVT